MPVEWSVSACADLARIYDFNAGRSEDWAEKVDDRLVARGEALAHTPSIGWPLDTRRRSLSVPDVQYVIVYEVEGRAVKIISVHSTRENRSRR